MSTKQLVYRSYIHYSPKLKTTQMTTNRRMDKQTVAYPSNAILLNNRKEQTTNTCNNMDESQLHYVDWKKPVTEEYVLCDSIYMKFWYKQN